MRNSIPRAAKRPRYLIVVSFAFRFADERHVNLPMTSQIHLLTSDGKEIGTPTHRDEVWRDLESIELDFYRKSYPGNSVGESELDFNIATIPPTQKMFLRRSNIQPKHQPQKTLAARANSQLGTNNSALRGQESPRPGESRHGSKHPKTSCLQRISRTSSCPLFPYPYPSPTRTSHNPFSQKVVPPIPPHFAMYMQIKDLQRSVGDRYATKGLRSGTKVAAESSPVYLCIKTACARTASDGISPSNIPPIFSLRLCVQALFCLFPPPESAL